MDGPVPGARASLFRAAALLRLRASPGRRLRLLASWAATGHQERAAAHVAANLNVGNDRQTLISVLTVL